MRPKNHVQPGYYPGFSTLDQQNTWDEATRKTVLQRVHHSMELHFFTPQEAPLIEAIFEHILPQSDRDDKYRIPIVPMVDERLHTNRLDGYRYENMPTDQEAYHLGIQAIEQIARSKDGRGFLDLTPLEQDNLLRTIHDGKPEGAHAIWERMPVHRFWMLMVQDAVEAYYAHPYAWDEIGFGGPAYPRAYMRLERGEAEPWEVEEQRYEWVAPEDSVSDRYEFVSGHDLHHATPGQGGSH
ncbi:MAG: gluconate 2-dehydrogenase subunit 3 family protein [Acidobacteriaceae bacterium]